MGMSTVASMIGGVMSGIALLTIAPLLGKVTLLFSAPEYFLVVILGLSIIGFIAANLMMGIIGMLICRQVIKITKVSDAILMAKKTPILQFYLSRPASLVLIILIIITVVVPAVQSIIKAVRKTKG